MFLNCFVEEDSLDFLGRQRDQTSQYPKGNQHWMFIGRTDAEAPILWPPDAKSQLIGKDTDAGKDWGQKEKWATEDEMVGWHHRLNGHEFAQTPGDNEGQWSLVWCSPRGHKQLDTTEQLSLSFFREIYRPGRDEAPRCCFSVTKSYLILCDAMDCSTLGFPVPHYLSEFAQIHVYWVSDVIQLSHPLLSPSPVALNLS